MARIGARITENTGNSGGNIVENQREVGSTVDPANIVFREDGSIGGKEGTSEEGTVQEGRRRRGRPPGSKNKSGSGNSKAAAESSLDINSVQFSLTGIHALLAIALNAPRLEMKEEQAKVIAANMSAVARHYDLQASAKAVDWCNLCLSLGAFYVPAVVLTFADKRVEREKNRPRPGFQPAPMHTSSPMSSPPAPASAQTHGSTGSPMAPVKGRFASLGPGVVTRPPTDEEKTAMLNEVPLTMFAQ